jgi:ribonuclease VapC
VIIDTSAIIAILRDEPEAMSFARAIADATIRRVSAINFVESAVVIDASHDPIATRRFDDFIREANISVEPVTIDQAQIARAAYRDFGKGSGHPARLNFGDCFAYALSKSLGEPLLYKGGDFAHTDITPTFRADLSR